MTHTQRRGRVARASLAAVAATAALGASALLAPGASAATHSAGAGKGHAATQKALDANVALGVPGVVAQARDARGTWNGTSGVGNLKTKKPRGADDRFRIGSISKTFVATVVLQLEADGKLDIDDKVDKWLPGVVRGNGHDGRRITIRQLLNHSSGIYNYTEDAGFGRKILSKNFLKHRYDTFTPRQLVKTAMGHRPYFKPGADWHYSNTNYILAGMIIEKATGHPYGTEVERRVLKPLKLRSTSLPGTKARVPGPHSRGYSTLFDTSPKAKVHDVTEMNPSWGHSAGEMISTTSDLNRFYQSLLGGRLLPAKQLKEMKTTIPMSKEAPNARYGLGLAKIKLPCSTTVWGHDGGIHGSASLGLTTGDGRHTLAANLNGDWAGDFGSVMTAEFCGKGAPAAAGGWSTPSLTGGE
ncbi:serine hydrolase [Streptomyces sp. SAJ15]|uniref:serine hydrolase domain-containing protein n=1 Tax=Streptomyces sp. SAJ15 TaxID=2011095 RepID=UPI0021B29BEC|nr:serine hydrolase domain-containing protein [Streptomyces sp. SAJ15]